MMHDSQLIVPSFYINQYTLTYEPRKPTKYKSDLLAECFNLFR